MGQQLSHDALDSTTLQEGKVPHAAKRGQGRLRVSAGAGETQAPGPQDSTEDPQVFEGPETAPGLLPGALLPKESESPSLPPTLPCGPSPRLGQRRRPCPQRCSRAETFLAHQLTGVQESFCVL